MKLPSNYDPLIKRLFCGSYPEFLNVVNMLTHYKQIDLQKTCRAVSWGVVYEDGTKDTFYSWSNLLQAVVDVYGIQLNLKKSYVSMHMFYLFFNEDPIVPSDPEVTLPVEEDIKASIQESQEEVLIDFDELLALKDDTQKRASKDALHKTVLKKYGINLNKGVIFDLMLEELRATIGSK